MSLIIEKYKYERLKRVEVDGKRRYAAPGHPPVASVTTILSGTKDMSHLIAWKKRVGEKKAQEIVTEASGSIRYWIVLVTCVTLIRTVFTCFGCRNFPVYS